MYLPPLTHDPAARWLVAAALGFALSLGCVASGKCSAGTEPVPVTLRAL